MTKDKVVVKEMMKKHSHYFLTKVKVPLLLYMIIFFLKDTWALFIEFKLYIESI